MGGESRDCWGRGWGDAVRVAVGGYVWGDIDAGALEDKSHFVRVKHRLRDIYICAFSGNIAPRKITVSAREREPGRFRVSRDGAGREHGGENRGSQENYRGRA